MKKLSFDKKLACVVACMILYVQGATAQTIDLGKTVQDQIVRPSSRQINIAFYKAEPKVKCSVRYMSVKFIVDPKTFVCNTVIFSKSIRGKFHLDPLAFKNFNINWRAIIDTSQCSQSNKYEVIQPISFFMGECFNKYPKLRDDQIWEIYTDLTMLDRRGRANVIILQPAYFSSDK